jgi:serine/threonine protein kinase/tetratricopeptide (TPR) repeat protein
VSLTGLVSKRSSLARGVCVGRYVVLDAIGEGGMGIVYKAYDPELERQVALKLLHAAHPYGAQDGSRHERLLREAKALARLSHPNVVAVFDVGMFESDVFIATEFVEGVTLHAWLRQVKRSQRDILRVMIDAGEGLAAAHRAGLVHRDFKPANVIVGQDGRARVLDFGLARAGASEGAPEASMRSPLAMDSSRGTVAAPRVHDSSIETNPAQSLREHRDLVPMSSPTPSPTLSPTSSQGLLHAPITRFGQIMGTPRYMAPEQHRGGIVDARGDQFSFCVSMYEALYGEPPFDKGVDEYASSVTAGKIKPAPPESDVPRRLRQLLVRGLSTSPDARHASMDTLLAELRRDRTSARRRTLALAVVAACAVTAAFAYAQVRREPERVCRGAEKKLDGVWDASRKSAVRDAFARTGSNAAPLMFAGVERALDQYAQRWAAMRTDACEATRVRGEQSEELLDLRMECLDTRLGELRAQVDVLTRVDVAMLDKSLAAAQSLTKLDGCADAPALRAPIRPPSDPSTKAHVEDVRAKLATAKAQQRVGSYGDAIALATDAAQAASATEYRPLEAEALFLLGDLQDDVGDYKTSEHTLLRAASAALLGRHEMMLARAFTALVNEVGLRQARFEEAHGWALLAETAASRSDPFVRGEVQRNLGRLLYREGRYADARAAIERCLAIWGSSLGAEDLAMAGPLTDLGNAFFAEARYDEAAATYLRSIAVLEGALGPGNSRLGANVNNLGEVYTKQGDYARAIETLERARILWEGSLGPAHPKVALALYNLGEATRRRGSPDQALPYYARALAIDEKAFGADHPDVAMVLTGIGETELALGHASAATPPLERALAFRAAHSGGDPMERADTEFALARALVAGGSTGGGARAKALATHASEGYAMSGARGAPRRREVDTWRERL